MNYIILAFTFLIGAAIGSFINVISLRYNSGLSFIKGESRCLYCNTPIPPYHLIPIFSFIFLWGRCAYCKSRLSISYFLAEVFSGLAFSWLFFKYGLSPAFFILFACYFLLAVIFLYDLRHKIIPDSFVYLFITLSLIYSLYSHASLQNILYSALLPALPFFLIWFFSKGRMMGLGDIKLMVGMGLLLGLYKGISAIFISFWLGMALVIVIYILSLLGLAKRITMKSELPFAPFLILGLILVFCLDLNLFAY